MILRSFDGQHPRRGFWWILPVTMWCFKMAAIGIEARSKDCEWIWDGPGGLHRGRRRRREGAPTGAGTAGPRPQSKLQAKLDTVHDSWTTAKLKNSNLIEFQDTYKDKQCLEAELCEFNSLACPNGCHRRTYED